MRLREHGAVALVDDGVNDGDGGEFVLAFEHELDMVDESEVGAVVGIDGGLGVALGVLEEVRGCAERGLVEQRAAVVPVRVRFREKCVRRHLVDSWR